MQVPSLPGSGKDIAEGKGVHREVESEGNRMREPTNPRANLWSDEQKSHRRLYMRVSLHNKIKMCIRDSTRSASSAKMERISSGKIRLKVKMMVLKEKESARPMKNVFFARSSFPAPMF